MALYKYIKAKPVMVAVPSNGPKRVSLFLITIGGGILVWSLWPIVSFSLFTAPLFSSVVSPLGEGDDSTQTSQLSSGGDFFAPVSVETKGQNTSVDFTNPNVWFPTRPQKKIVTPVNAYKLSIPKLGIDDATVIISGDDLNKSLIHYGGTGIPGQYGTTVVFGHSVLPQFFNPKSYTTIFSTLPTLKKGDELLVDYDGVQYRYRIYDMVITQPNDLAPLEQRFDDSHLTLITCVPPGLKTARLNVHATIVHPA